MASSKKPKKRRACVLVLGDIGRSPRMQYHAMSFSNTLEMEVDLLGSVLCLSHSSTKHTDLNDVHLLIFYPFHVVSNKFFAH